jgi:hypothetical protein
LELKEKNLLSRRKNITYNAQLFAC